MYTSCIFCHELLGTNEHIAHFPVGRRLAFDSAKGRLWVVCRRCAQWNLAPLEERWEAVEDCERAYRSVRTRVSTAEIGLARMADGLDLVRIGAPLRPEFAAWRFGDQLGARRRRMARRVLGGAGMLAGSGLAIASGLAMPLLIPVIVIGGAVTAGVLTDSRESVRRYMRPLNLTADDGTNVALGREEVLDVQMRSAARPEGFQLAMDVVQPQKDSRTYEPPRHVTLSGKQAVQAARLLLPRINGAGATRNTVQSAVEMIEDAGSAERFIPHAMSVVRKSGLAYSPIHVYPTPVRLGVEMVLHEEAERRAMEGELAELEAAWRDAERIAGIADDLLLPGHVNVFLDKHRKR